MRAKGRCPKKVEAETVQHGNTDNTSLPHGSWERPRPVKSVVKNEWKLPLQH